MSTPTNTQLYEKAKIIITKTYGSKTSAYRSMAIVKQYKRMGGTYKKNDNTKPEGTSRWLKEKWIQVIPFLTYKQEKPCGSSHRRKHACRPSVRISKNTPITIQEVVIKHGKKKTKQLASKKKQNSEKSRVHWVKGKLTKTNKKYP